MKTICHRLVQRHYMNEANTSVDHNESGGINMKAERRHHVLALL